MDNIEEFEKTLKDEAKNVTILGATIHIKSSAIEIITEDEFIDFINKRLTGEVPVFKDLRKGNFMMYAVVFHGLLVYYIETIKKE
ncbi:Uncharacterised protein [uncultured archaeon]|nr:Uncharacterised protein [uncultured archaeon]